MDVLYMDAAEGTLVARSGRQVAILTTVLSSRGLPFVAAGVDGSR
jgi:hypothetical protein